LNVLCSNVGAVRIVRLEGEDTLETGSAPEVKRAVLQALEGAGDAVVDLSAVEFMDSAGIGVLVSIYKAQRQRGFRLAFAGIRSGVASVLELLKLDRIFLSLPDVDSALRSLGH
jgi:anti-sigma B factor antagonist